jgi:uncharacterized membrane protein
LSPAWRVWLATAVYAAVYFVLGADRYVTYHSGADLGLFTQTIASAFHGFSNTTEGGSHFTFHFSPILYLCAPLLWFTHSPLALVAIQALAGGLAAPPLFYLARRRVGERLAWRIALVALLYPPLAGVTFTDFHENGFAPAATLWLIWAADARRWGWVALFLALCLGIKEDQGPLLAFAGLFAAVYFARRGERAGVAFSLGAVAVSLATFVAFFAFVRPLAGATDAWGPLHFYTWSHIVDPRGSAPWYSIGRPAYFLEAMVPLVFVCCFSPLFILALPAFAEVLLSHESITYTMGQHYAAVWIGYVLAAFALGVARIARRHPLSAQRLVTTSAVLCGLVLVFASPTHWGHYLRLRTAHDVAIDRAFQWLPPTAPVGTHDELYAHLGFDPNASLGLRRDPQYALFDNTYWSSYWVERVRPRLIAEVAAGTYRIVRSDDGIQLFLKTRRPSLGSAR